MALPLTARPGVDRDILVLPSKELKARALKLLAEIKRNPRLGKPLSFQLSTGNLADCRTVYLGETKASPPLYRIVYRVLPSEKEPESIEIVIVGERVHSEVYREAVRRLGRS